MDGLAQEGTSAESVRGDRERFACTAQGELTRSRRRKRRLLWIAALFMLVVFVLTIANGRVGPALLALGMALVLGWTHRVSGDLDLLWLEVEGDSLRLRMRHREERVSLPQATARHLDGAEIEHLVRLTSSGGLLGATSFDSHVLGEFDLYATQLTCPVLVEIGEEHRIIVTPDDPDRFLSSVKARARTA